MNAARALLPLAEFKRQFLDLLSCVENQTGAKTWLLEELVPQGWTGAAEDGEEDPHLLFPSWIPRTNVATLIGQALQCVAARPQGNTTGTSMRSPRGAGEGWGSGRGGVVADSQQQQHH